MWILLTFTVSNQPLGNELITLKTKVGNRRLNNHVFTIFHKTFSMRKKKIQKILQIMMNSLISSLKMENPENKYLVRLQFTEFWLQLLWMNCRPWLIFHLPWQEIGSTVMVYLQQFRCITSQKGTIIIVKNVCRTNITALFSIWWMMDFWVHVSLLGRNVISLNSTMSLSFPRNSLILTKISYNFNSRAKKFREFDLQWILHFAFIVLVKLLLLRNFCF